jgi:nucleotide-binding universal stress UspA family protein
LKIIATFDRSHCAETVMRPLKQLARVPGLKCVLLSVEEIPKAVPRQPRSRPRASAIGALHAQPIVIEPQPAKYAETKNQAIERGLAELDSYLRDIISQLPEGPEYTVETHVSDDPAATIIQRALVERPDLIVMATHGRRGVVRHIFGDVAEEVARSAVAPVLLVPPEASDCQD